MGVKIDMAAYALRHPGLIVPAAPGAALRRSKYGNRRTEYGGRTYDSALEAGCAAHLDALARLGFVVGWVAQPRYRLAAGVVYVADFSVSYSHGAPRVLDAKGVLTSVFKIKRKLFEGQYGPLDVVRRWQEIPLSGL